MEREDLHILARHSTSKEEYIQKILEEDIYNSEREWRKFIKYLLLTFGIGFSTAGTVFFFAYNWNQLHRFAKLGLAEVLIIACMGITIFTKTTSLTRNILLTACSVLVGVLFAVYGQVYQTGANAYNFFLGWTIFISLWVFISRFEPLWLIFITLINTTYFLYTQQVVKEWDSIFIGTTLLLLNSTFLSLSIGLLNNVATWFTHTLAFACCSIATASIALSIFSDFKYPSLYLVLITGVLYTFGILYGLKNKSLYYLAMIALSFTICISCLFLKAKSNDEISLLLIALFVLLSVSLTVKGLLSLQKRWKNEN